MPIKTQSTTSLRCSLALALACGAWIPGLLHAAVYPSNSAALQWSPNSETNIVGYKVHIGSASGTYHTVLDVVGASRISLPQVPLGSTLYLAVSAYNAAGMESELSTELVVIADVPKPAAATSFTMSSPGQGKIQWKYPKNTAVPAERFTVYESENLVTWKPASELHISESSSSDAQWHHFQFAHAANKPRMFFQVGTSNAFGESR